MQINQDDILFVMELCLHHMSNNYLNEEADILKQNNQFSEKNLTSLFEKLSCENIIKSEYGVTIIQGMISAAISQYHEQLREKLLESGIDIGEMDSDSTPLRDGYKKLNLDDE